MSEAFSSDKHGPLHDDALKAETEGLVRSGHSTHAEEWKDPEPSGEDQPDVDRAPEGSLVGGVPEGMTADDVDGRSELARFLGRPYPADKATLLDGAQNNDAPAEILARLQTLPERRTFDNLHDVWEAAGGGSEQTRF